MALKYFIKYQDVVNVEHILNIYDDNYVGNATRVGGRVFLDYGEVDNPIEAIRGQGLRVELEANAGLNFNDLFTEEERTINCQYSRAGIILFNGWLNPEGFFEDFVQSDWVVSFDCVDGLSYLSDLAFVDENGFPIEGRKKYIEILAIALKRTGLSLKINTDVRIRYVGLDPLLDPLDNVYANTARYVEEDRATTTDCEKVIRDILEPFTACITLFNNEWYIYKPSQLFTNQTADFYSYDADGVFIEKKTLVTAVTIGSQINDFAIFHCSANQSITNKSSLGAYRVNYKYGLVKDVLFNRDFFSNNGLTLDGYTIYSDSPSGVLLENPGFGARVTIEFPYPFNNFYKELRTNQNVVLNVGERLKIELQGTLFAIETEDPFEPPINIKARISFAIFLSDSLNFDSNPLFIYDDNLGSTTRGQWRPPLIDPFIQDRTKYIDVRSAFDTDENEIDINTGQAFNLVTEIPPIPDGFESLNVFVILNGGNSLSAYDSGGQHVLRFDKLLVNPLVQTFNQEAIGEFHTVQRTTKPSAKVDEVKKVLTGDNPSDFYEGTIYKSDSITPTDFWAREGVSENKPLLQIMVEDTARMQQSTAREFSGDVFGYYAYISVISIDGLNGLFMPIKYQYDTKENIISGTLRQIFADEVADLEYKYTLDFGNTVKPTIKG
jgi:hypothetical protein